MAPDDDAGVEILERQAPRGVSRRMRRVAAVVVAAALLVGLGAWAEGVRRAPEERRALAGCADHASAAVARAEARLSTMAGYIAPGLWSGSRGLDASLHALVAEQVEVVEGPVRSSLARCRDLELWPVGGSRREARAAYVDLLVAETERLDRIRDDGSEVFEGHDVIKRLADRAAELHRPRPPVARGADLRTGRRDQWHYGASRVRTTMWL